MKRVVSPSQPVEVDPPPLDSLLAALPPRRAVDGGQVAYGRYCQAIADPNVRASGVFGRFRLKEWHYTSVSSDHFFLAFGLVHLGYLANAFCYLVDHTTGDSYHAYEAMAPFGFGLRFAPSSVRGVTRWRKGGQSIEVRWEEGWHIRIDVMLRDRRDRTERLCGELHYPAGESLVLLHPLPSGKPAYTHKESARPTVGTLHWRDERVPVDGLGTLDWTRSVALRETTWKWASFTTRGADGHRIGLNLSAEVYDDADGASRENAAWLGDRPHVLGGVRFEVPAHPERDPWRIRSLHGDEVDLTFQPMGARSQNVDYRLIRSEFVQPYGRFTGTLRVSGVTVPVDGAFGVVEDHRSLW